MPILFGRRMLTKPRTYDENKLKTAQKIHAHYGYAARIIAGKALSLARDAFGCWLPKLEIQWRALPLLFLKIAK